MKHGGVARRAAYVDSLRSEGMPLLLMDAGNFFARENRATDVLSVVAWKEMERLGYDAVTLGPAELRNWELVRLLLPESSLKLVTTNLEWKPGDRWEPVGPTHLIIERGDLRIGLIGLIVDTDVPAWILRAAGGNLRVLPTVCTAKRACDRLRDQVDLLIALVASDSDRFGELTCCLPEIDVLVGGRGVCLIDGRARVEASTRGQKLGITRMTVRPSGEPIALDSRCIELKPTMSEDPVLAEDARRVVALSARLQEELRHKWRSHRARRARGLPRAD